VEISGTRSRRCRQFVAHQFRFFNRNRQNGKEVVKYEEQRMLEILVLDTCVTAVLFTSFMFMGGFNMLRYTT